MSDVVGMGKAAVIPTELTSRPFTVDEAKRAGVSLTALRGKAWLRIATGLYCWAGLDPDPWLTLTAWRQSLADDVAFAGSTAAWMHGLDYHPLNPVEVLAPPDSGLRSRAGLSVRRSKVRHEEVVSIRSLSTTSIERTLCDLCARGTDIEALVAVDMALHRYRTDRVALAHYARSARRAGVARLQRVLPLAERAESPMETRLRWLFLENRLPRPQVQVDLMNPSGQIIGRADMLYASDRVVIEFDGANHKERLVTDNRRQNLIINAGYQILRFTTSDLRDRSDVIVAQVRAALARSETHAWRQNGEKRRAKHRFGAKEV